MGRESEYSLAVAANHSDHARDCAGWHCSVGGRAALAGGPWARAHGAALVSSVRSRTRLYAALVKAKIHATWSRPR
jgi:hypothetical protein